MQTARPCGCAEVKRRSADEREADIADMSNWNQDAIRVSGGISVSKNDKREWHTTTLPNGLVIICISDVECVLRGGRPAGS